MSPQLAFAGVVALIVVAVVAVVALGVAITIIRMVNAYHVRYIRGILSDGFPITVADTTDDDPRMDHFAGVLDDVEHAGFVWHGLYEARTLNVDMLVAIWTRARRCEVASAMVVTAQSNQKPLVNKAVTITTRFDEHNGLDTTDSVNGLSGPAQPGRFCWALPGLAFPELLREHERARDELMRTHAFTIAPLPADLIADVERANFERARYVASRPFWKHVGAWYYFTRKTKARKELWRKAVPARAPVP